MIHDTHQQIQTCILIWVICLSTDTLSLLWCSWKPSWVLLIKHDVARHNSIRNRGNIYMIYMKCNYWYIIYCCKRYVICPYSCNSFFNHIFSFSLKRPSSCFLLGHWKNNKQGIKRQSVNPGDVKYTFYVSLQWIYNERDGVPNHQPHYCLLNRLFRRRPKKTSKLRVTGIFAGIHRWPAKSLQKGPVTRKIILFDDVIMWTLFGCWH